MKRLSALFPILLLVGCANTTSYLRSQPVTHIPAKSMIAIPSDLDGLISLHCVKEQEVRYGDASNDYKECLYITADVSKIAQPPSNGSKAEDVRKVRDKAISFLTSLSDLNCSNFLHRSFANKTSFDFSKGLAADLASGASAGTAFSSPPLSAALSVGNIFIGKSVDAFNATYYQQQTFHALESAIQSERIRLKKVIKGKQTRSAQNKGSYDIYESLADIRAYDDACSFKAGLSKLVEIADEAKKNAPKTKVSE